MHCVVAVVAACDVDAACTIVLERICVVSADLSDNSAAVGGHRCLHRDVGELDATADPAPAAVEDSAHRVVNVRIGQRGEAAGAGGA